LAFTGVSPALISGLHRSLLSLVPAQEGQSLLVQLRGVPGDRAFLTVGAPAVGSYAQALHGPARVGQPRALLLGSVAANGELDVYLPVRELGPGLLGHTLAAQGLFLDASNSSWVSGPAALVTLDASLGTGRRAGPTSLPIVAGAARARRSQAETGWVVPRARWVDWGLPLIGPGRATPTDWEQTEGASPPLGLGRRSLLGSGPRPLAPG
jgi:hypothetical protein